MGIAAPNTSAQTLTGGALRFGDWAGAITETIRRTPLAGSTDDLHSNAMRTVAALVKAAGCQVGPVDLDMARRRDREHRDLDVVPATGASLFSITGAGLEAGATWIPHMQSFRIGGAASTGISGSTVSVNNCADPASCDGFILPDRVVSSWRVAAGGAYRWSPTRWNQLVPWKYRDERAITVAADVVVTGPSANAFGLDAFGIHELERSGRHSAVSPRGGAEYEWIPGRLRVRGGSYWEPGRFEGVSGRVHATFGAEVDVFHFHFWGPRRLLLSATSDVAEKYRNLGLSIGFWH